MNAPVCVRPGCACSYSRVSRSVDLAVVFLQRNTSVVLRSILVEPRSEQHSWRWFHIAVSSDVSHDIESTSAAAALMTLVHQTPELEHLYGPATKWRVMEIKPKAPQL